MDPVHSPGRIYVPGLSYDDGRNVKGSRECWYVHVLVANCKSCAKFCICLVHGFVCHVTDSWPGYSLGALWIIHKLISLWPLTPPALQIKSHSPSPWKLLHYSGGFFLYSNNASTNGNTFCDKCVQHPLELSPEHAHGAWILDRFRCWKDRMFLYDVWWYSPKAALYACTQWGWFD